MLCTLRGRAHETTDMIRGGARNRARALKSMTLSSIVPPHLRLYRLACTANSEPPAFGRQFLQSKVRNNGWPSARSYSATTRERIALRGCLLMALLRRIEIAIERRLSGQKQTLERPAFHDIRYVFFEMSDAG